ncbi:hypothetical protein KRR26_24905 [Corallococcus sp. M34]|uniref:hypothetical protein n=1 Tax=Citreicoccus inhibens TaxID=2849499 RepID=UPI0013153D01|nr:hypothetical protein [Citreicoccus inhibens]MBU8898855.1 hypothetical protein [Citreicoccus inhibens]
MAIIGAALVGVLIFFGLIAAVIVGGVAGHVLGKQARQERDAREAEKNAALPP